MTSERDNGCGVPQRDASRLPPRWSLVEFTAAGLAGRRTRHELDHLCRDLFLPHKALLCLQVGEIAGDMTVSRSHRLHPRLVLGGKGVERGVAELRVEMLDGQAGEQVYGCQIVKWEYRLRSFNIRRSERCQCPPH